MVNSSKKSFLIYTHTTRKQGIKSPHSKPSQYPESVANPTYKPTSTHLQKGDNSCTFSIAAFLTFAFCDTLQCNLYSYMSYEPIWKTFRLFALYDMWINFSTLHIATHPRFNLPMYNGNVVNPTSVNGFPLIRYVNENFSLTFGGISWVHISV